MQTWEGKFLGTWQWCLYPPWELDCTVLMSPMWTKPFLGMKSRKDCYSTQRERSNRQWPRLRAQSFSGQGSFPFLHWSNDRVKLFQPRGLQGIQMACILHLSCPLHQERHKQDSCHHLVVDLPTRMNTRMALETASAVIQEGLSLQLREINGCREMT